MTWIPGDRTDLEWLASVAVEADYRCGFDVGPMPDAVLVLHPIYARVDGAPVAWDALTGWTAGPLPKEFRRVPWSEYAATHGVEMFVPGRGVSIFSLEGITEDDSVCPPSEGIVDDHEVWDAIMNGLVVHSANGPDTECTAFYDPFWLWDPNTGAQMPSVFKGRLRDHRSLFERSVTGPQNLWPVEHDWVLYTHLDSWATQVSGPVKLIEALTASPILDTYRLADLPASD